ncbi:MAG: hypothetical protein KKF46_03550 [Nanoarchaeota archaeon]|nr:hypothetical protein [Nanoarchaeota archaeon]MBU1321410.1 hypothetical protein [Nanoarchaeota archaeon]MBU1597889.1 hypothetical protein [Nanoarchaeota archaeon]MBU2442270.1 hypothetical protein [Nanoarchaeota archaeon]
MADPTETNTLGEILDAAVDDLISASGPGPGNALPTVDSNARKKGELFFYQWWAFKSEEDFRIIQNAHAYPDSIEKLERVEYNEVGTKDINIIMENGKPEGKVSGKYLGIKGLTFLDQEFENKENFTTDPNEYPIIALGGAVARKEDLKAKDPKFRTLNAQGLTWRWAMWKDGEGEKFYTIRGRLMEHGSWTPPPPKPTPSNHDDPTALAWAKNIVNGTDGSGIDGHDVTVKYRKPGAGKDDNSSDKTKTVTISGTDVDGIFEIKNIPKDSKIKEIKSTTTTGGYVTSEIEFMEDLALNIDDTTAKPFMNVVLSKKPAGPGVEEILIVPTPNFNPHNNPCDVQFGPTTPSIITLSTATPSKTGENLPFKLKEVKHKKSTECYYHIFFMDHTGQIIDWNRLTTYFNIQNIKVFYQSGIKTGSQSYNNNYIPVAPYTPYYKKFNLDKNTTVTITADFHLPMMTPPAIARIFAFVSVQRKKYDADATQALKQVALDKRMYQQVITPSDALKTSLKKYGVLDFNLMPIFIRKLP